MKQVSIQSPKADHGEALLSSPGPRKISYKRCASHAHDELKSFRSCLRWMCVDHSDRWRTAISWSLFTVLTLVVPVASHFFMTTYADSGQCAYDLIVQLSLTSASIISYVCLSNLVQRYGLRRFLFLDKLVGESERVRLGYTSQLNRSFLILSNFVLPCFVAEVIYKLIWYLSGQIRLNPGSFLLFHNPLVTQVFVCMLELASWLYRTSIFFLVCVLFRLLCYLQILRMQDFQETFQQSPDVTAVLKEHLRIRKQLHVISHRYRMFIVSILILVTASQFVVLFLTTRPRALVNWSNVGDLALCSMGLVTGLLICLRSAAKITHKAQAITSHAATWHVCATIDSSDDPEVASSTEKPNYWVLYPRDESGDEEEEVGDEDVLDDTRLVSAVQFNNTSFQKRQSLVTYLENNKAGITVFGFVVDRTWLHALFMIEFSLILWMLGKTVGIS